VSRKQATAGSFGPNAGAEIRRDVLKLVAKIRRQGLRVEHLTNARRLIALARSLPAAAGAQGAADQLQEIIAEVSSGN
jgi:hypothetical protein